MGNTHGQHGLHGGVSRQSTSSDLSGSGAAMCPHRSQSVRVPARRVNSNNSSTDSEPNNNNKSASVSSTDIDVLQVASQRSVIPIKQRKVSRAASAGRIRQRRGIGLGSFSAKNESLRPGTKDSVQQSWTLLNSFAKDSTQIGLGIYQRIFDQAPELKAVFSIPDNVTTVDSYEPFHRSGKLFVSVIDLCVRSIHTLESDMGPILVMYGRRHFHRQEQGFRIQYLPLFQSCIYDYIIDNLPEEERTCAVLDGWKGLLKYIMGKLAEGFELELQRTASSRRKSVL